MCGARILGYCVAGSAHRGEIALYLFSASFGLWEEARLLDEWKYIWNAFFVTHLIEPARGL